MKLPPIAECPAWVIDLAGGVSPHKRSEDLTPLVELDSPAAVTRAKTFLLHHDPAVQHSGGDQHTFRTACLVKDYGLSESMCLELMAEHWNERCSPPWMPDDLAKKVENAYAYGENAPGLRSEEVDFADVPTQIEAPKQPQKAPPLTPNQWAARDLPEPDYLLGSWLHTTSRALIVGATGVGKTNFGLALAAAMAAGKPFLSWPARRPCKVLYIDGEMSRRLMKQRIADACRRLGETPDTLFVFSHEDAEAFRALNTPEGRAYVEGLINFLGGVDFIVFDNIMCLLEGDMKETDAWAKVQPWVLSLTKRGIGQGWLHHTGHDESRSYGDKTKEWGLDTVLHLTGAKRDGIDVSFDLTFRKARERTPENHAEFVDINVALSNDAWVHGVVDRRSSADEDFSARVRKTVGASAVALRFIVEATEKAREGLDVFAPDPWIPVAEIAEQCRGTISSGEDRAQRLAFQRVRNKLEQEGLVEVKDENMRLIR